MGDGDVEEIKMERDGDVEEKEIVRETEIVREMRVMDDVDTEINNILAHQCPLCH